MEIKNYHKNPREISPKQLVDLERWLEELGDLSGIVIDINSNEIISGNQRGKAMNLDECEISTSEHTKPDKQGTVATGVIKWRGAEYSLRLVDWDAKTCEKANIIANKAGGVWDFEILVDEFKKEDLIDWGWKEGELPKLKDEVIEGEVEFAEELLLEHNYVVLYFDNEMDWQVAVDKLELKRVKSNAVTEKSRKIGLGRVIKGAPIVAKL